MKHEIVEFQNVQIIGMAKEIAFNNPAECTKFWGEYVERIVKPVFMEGKAPDGFQKAAMENEVGEFGLCTCHIPTITAVHAASSTLPLVTSRHSLTSSEVSTRVALFPRG